MEWILLLNVITGIFLTVCYAYQIFYIIYALIVKPKKFKEVEPKHRFAVMISARNEEGVIPYLLDTIKTQTYPSELIDIYVIADNCTDHTADVCREKGAIVYERFDKVLVGKGYALDFLLGEIDRKHGITYYDGYFVFDADNLLDKNFIKEMDKCFSEGHNIITSYRNSKNYGDNWISAGYALWFIREARFLNNPRFLLNNSCAVSGTGFLVNSQILKKYGGWKFFLLTEDIQFSITNVANGEKIAYCHDAMLFDEQPNKFSVSWRQRLRWSKGFLQVVKGYGGKLMKQIFLHHNFSAFDMFMTIAPAFLLTFSVALVNVCMLLYFVGKLQWFMVLETLKNFSFSLLGGYLGTIVLGLITIIVERKNIHCSTARTLLLLLTFPLYMMTYIPISLQALFSKVEWKPIQHNVAVSVDDVKKAAEETKKIDAEEPKKPDNKRPEKSDAKETKKTDDKNSQKSDAKKKKT